MTWPDPVERVAVFLRAAGAECRLEELSAPARTASAAAKQIGCGVEQIVVVHVFACDRRPVVALVPGDRGVAASKVAYAAVAATARPARTVEIEALTGDVTGYVTPLALPAGVRALVDATVLSSPVVWVSAGTDRHLAMLAPVELVRLTRGQVVDLVRESA